MNITDLIVELLENGQKVVMPGIGTLDTVQRAAHHDPATRTYYPAGRAIAFSEDSTGECDIIKTLAERECINEEVAKQMWLNYIDALTDKVKSSGRHTFGRLGTLTCDDKRTFGFKMTEGLVLDADNKGVMPIEEVKTYNHDGEEDPFARFDDEEAPAPAPEPMPEPAPEPAPAPKPMPAEQPEAAEESHWDESLKKLENLKKEEPAADPKAVARAEKERLKAEKKAEEERIKLEKKAAEQQRYEEEQLAKQRKEAEKREAEEKRKAAEELRKAEERAEKERIKAEKEAEANRKKAEKEAAKAEYKSEKERIKAEKKAAALAAMAARENAKANDNRNIADKEAERKAEKQAAKQEEARRKAEAKERKQAEKAAKKANKKANKKEGEKKRRVLPILLIIVLLLALCGGGAYYLLNRGNNAAPDTTASTTHIDASPVNSLTFNPDMIDYSGNEIAEQGDMVCLFMTEYINNYLAERNFTCARVPMMDRIRQYVNERLEEMLGERFAVQRLIQYNDYIYNYNEPFLKVCYARSCRGKVQSELMNYRWLDDMLYRLADELGLQPGNGGQKTAAEVQQVKEDEKKVIERRRQAAQTGEPPVYVYVEKGSKQGFDLIAGFYLNKMTAAKMTAKLHDMGCDAYIIEFNDLYYVSMGSASSQTAADALYKHVKSWYDGDVVIKKW